MARPVCGQRERAGRGRDATTDVHTVYVYGISAMSHDYLTAPRLRPVTAANKRALRRARARASKLTLEV